MNTKSIHWRGFLTEGMDLCQRGARTNYVLNGAAAIGHSGDQGCSKFWFFWCKCTIPGMTLTERNKENTLESLDDSLDSDICIYIHTLPNLNLSTKSWDFFCQTSAPPAAAGFSGGAAAEFSAFRTQLVYDWAGHGSSTIARQDAPMPGISSDGFRGKPKKQNMSFFEGAFLKPERAPSSSSKHPFSRIFKGGTINLNVYIRWRFITYPQGLGPMWSPKPTKLMRSCLPWGT